MGSMLTSPQRGVSRFIAGSIPYLPSFIFCIIQPVFFVAELLCTSMLPFMFINKQWFLLYKIFWHVVMNIICQGCRQKLKTNPRPFNKKPKPVNDARGPACSSQNDSSLPLSPTFSARLLLPYSLCSCFLDSLWSLFPHTSNHLWSKCSFRVQDGGKGMPHSKLN